MDHPYFQRQTSPLVINDRMRTADRILKTSILKQISTIYQDISSSIFHFPASTISRQEKLEKVLNTPDYWEFILIKKKNITTHNLIEERHWSDLIWSVFTPIESAFSFPVLGQAVHISQCVNPSTEWRVLYHFSSHYSASLSFCYPADSSRGIAGKCRQLVF